MPKFLLDENVPPVIGVFLRNLDFDAVHAKDYGMLGASDKRIMDLARQEKRTLITFDKHFADLLLYPPGTHWGVIRLLSFSVGFLRASVTPWFEECCFQSNVL